MTQTQLLVAYQHPIIINLEELKISAQFWPYYQQAKYDELTMAKRLVKHSSQSYQF